MTEQPRIILVAPQLPENIGAAARAMRNFGLDRMRLVAPREGWPDPRATATAAGATAVLDHAGLFDSTGDAIADCQFVLATTARPRSLATPVMGPEAAMAAARRHAARGARVGILFGGERAGLSTGDVARANAIVTLPVDPAFASLNLAQAVLVLAYEWGRAAQVPPAPGGTRPPAPRAATARLAAHAETALDEAGFFHPPARAARMKRNLHALFARLELTEAETRLIHGAIRALVRGGRGPG